MGNRQELPDRPSIRFLGAAQTVTGSRFLVETPKARVLIECGLFQGSKPLRLRNWGPFPVAPRSIDAVVLTHAHLDHVGYLPALVKAGFAGSVHVTDSTGRLCAVVLPDSGRLQEEDAEFANRKGFSKHKPALPLYTEDDALVSLDRLVSAPWHRPIEVAEGVTIAFQRAGHILGSAALLVTFADGTPPLFVSGDVGRPNHPVLLPPEAPPAAATFVVESTYGDRDHPDADGTDELAEAVAKTAARGGAVVIPAFAVDRTEVVLLALRRLTETGRIPRLPVYLDSPLAGEALAVYERAIGQSHPEIRPDLAGDQDPFDNGRLVVTATVAESKAINSADLPCVIISASGMATGGRVLHHLARRLPDPDSSVVLVGYQAEGTRGQRLLAGEGSIKIHGREVPVKAEVFNVPAFSVHADRDEMIAWLDTAPRPPGRLLAVHGDASSATAFAETAGRHLGAKAWAPGHDERVPLD